MNNFTKSSVSSHTKTSTVRKRELGSLDFSNIDTIIFSESCISSSFTLNPGIYHLQAWGSSGGVREGYLPAKGGYSSGYLALNTPIKMFVTVGSKGKSIRDSNILSIIEGGCNGGGNGLSAEYNNSYYHSSGGGATDFRLINDSLTNRVLVAGGAGGSPYNVEKADITTAGFGGGEEGGRGRGGNEEDGLGGTQNEPGLGCVNFETEKCTPGSFGSGGSPITEYGDGGGGGWFGGASSRHTATAPGGGSGFAYTKPHPNCLLPVSLFLKNAKTISNVWVGDGLALITKIKVLPSCKIRFHGSVLLHLFNNFLISHFSILNKKNDH